MIKEQLTEQLFKKAEKVYAEGKLLDYALYGDIYQKKRYRVTRQQYETQSYNKVQNFLYKRALYGLRIYNDTEIKELPTNLKGKIIRIYKRANQEINLLKQSIIIDRTNDILSLFPNSLLAKAILEDDYTDPSLKNKLNFKDLGIKKEDIIDRLHSVGALPQNFHEINAE